MNNDYLSDIVPVAPLQVQRLGRQAIISIGGLDPIYIVLTSSVDVTVGGQTRTAWRWNEVVRASGGNFVTLDGGKAGDEFAHPAFEANPTADSSDDPVNSTAAVGNVYKAFPGAGADQTAENDWDFEYVFDGQALVGMWGQLVANLSPGWSFRKVAPGTQGGWVPVDQGNVTKIQQTAYQSDPAHKSLFATAVAVAAGGSGYAVGDYITLAGGTSNPAILLCVTAVSSGAVSTVAIINYGNYSGTVPTNPVAQGSTTGGGTGATANVTWSSATASGMTSQAGDVVWLQPYGDNWVFLPVTSALTLTGDTGGTPTTVTGVSTLELASVDGTAWTVAVDGAKAKATIGDASASASGLVNRNAGVQVLGAGTKAVQGGLIVGGTALAAGPSPGAAIELSAGPTTGALQFSNNAGSFPTNLATLNAGRYNVGFSGTDEISCHIYGQNASPPYMFFEVIDVTTSATLGTAHLGNTVNGESGIFQAGNIIASENLISGLGKFFSVWTSGGVRKDGQSGTDPVGNVFTGGIMTTLAGAITTVSGGTW